MAVEKKENKKEPKANTKLVLLDVHAILHRAYHALPDFTSGKGEPTGALYGLSAMLIKIIRELSPDYLVACYDLPKPTVRHEVYKDYKKGRPKTDDELSAQIKRSHDVFKAFDIPVYEAEGFEADDIIGTITKKAKNDPNQKIVIASGDMDTLQLVDDKKVFVYTLKKGLSETILYDEDKVRERFGFAPSLLPDYKGIAGDPSDNIIGIKGLGEKTTTILISTFGSLENIYKTLKKNKDAFYKIGLKDRQIALLEKGKEDALFSRILATVRSDAPIPFRLPEKPWSINSSRDAITALFSELGFRSLIGRLNEILPVSKSIEAPDSQEVVSEKEVQKTGIALWLCDSSVTNPSLSDILQWANTKSFREARERIFEKLREGRLSEVYEQIEFPLIPVLEETKSRGVCIDTKFLSSLSKKYHKELDFLQRNIWELAGGEFNINSPKQLGEILFDALKLKVTGIKKTEGGARSTRASELEKLSGAHPIIEKLLKYRELQKLLSTYIDNIPDMLGEDGRLHTEYIQTGTTTGRFASQNPNLQNIPIKTELGREVRKAFIASDGFSLLALDYSQIELRIAALLSNDPKLIKIFKEGRDVHSATASEVFKVPLAEVTYDMRRVAKIINFGIIYGMGVNALKENLETTREEAQKFYDTYFKTFSGLAAWIEKVKKDAAQNGFTETYFGRRRYFPGLRSPLPYIRAQEERMAVNAPLQGTSADIIKLAMVRIYDTLKKGGLEEDAHLVLQIHDELVYEVRSGREKEIGELIGGIMENVWKEKVPLIVDVSKGANFGEMEKMKLRV